jgi:hypothetical protein
LHRNFANRVAVLAQTSSSGIKTVLERREGELATVNDEVHRVRDEVRHAVGKP